MKTLTKTNERRLNDNRLINMCNEEIKLNEMIVKELNEKKDLIIKKCSIEEIEFSPEVGELTYVSEFEDAKLRNTVTTQKIEIYTVTVINEEIIENSIDIFLCENTIAFNYLKNAGIDNFECMKEIVQTISNYSQEPWTIKRGRLDYIINEEEINSIYK